MKKIIFSFAFIFALTLTVFAQDKNTGGVKGTVKSTEGNKIPGVAVTARQEGKEIASARTDAKGDFTLVGLKPGVYRFVFNKEGLSEGVSSDVTVKAGNMLTLKRLIMSVDKGTLAQIRGSVFDPDGRIVRGAKVEIFKVTGESLRKLGERYSDGNGEFAYRLPSQAARYRFTVSIEGAETVNKDLEVNGAEVYRFAVSLKVKN